MELEFDDPIAWAVAVAWFMILMVIIWKVSGWEVIEFKVRVFMSIVSLPLFYVVVAIMKDR